MKCPKIETCLFLKKYPQEYKFWASRYCDDVETSEKCKRKSWCRCRGPIASNFTPDGKFYK